MLSDVVVVDRSRHECWQVCPRKRYWEYHYDGIGLQRTAHSVPLLTGSIVHEGLAALMIGAPVDIAVNAALAGYDAEIKARSLEDTHDPNVDVHTHFLWLVKSNRALIEGLIRAYALIRLPKVLAEYEILEVEREEEATFIVGGSGGAIAQGQGTQGQSPAGRTVKFLARTDALTRRRADGQLYIRNFKTVSDASNTWQAAFRYDTQTISEVIAVEQRLGQRVSGVIIDGLIKQPRKCEYPKGSGVWHHCSPLIWGWQRPGNPPIDSEDWQSQYEWQDAFGKTSRLGKGYSRKLVSESYPGGVQAWIAQLGESILADQFIELPPILRADWQVEEWLDTTLNLEVNIGQYAADVNELVERHADDGYGYREHLLRRYFPKFTANSNCFHQFGSQCSCFALCWGGAADDPLANGYQRRIPNHLRESELVQLKVGV